jgi:luciferase family oxidoreductase group 1
MKLGVLDQSPVRKGGTTADAIAETIQLAKHCETLGYHRYWLAEHHNTTSFAGSSPEIMITRVAAETSKMRVGAGGVMLTHYSPLKVAENFRVLETLYPGRIDLGLGRAPGADQRTSMALQAGPQAWSIEAFPQQVALLRAFLEDAKGDDAFGAEHPYRGIHASPRGPGLPEMWMLGSGVHSAIYAAELGLGFSFAHFINADGGPEVTQAYRERFKPSEGFPSPQVSVGVFVLCAETEDEAQRLAATRNLWVLQLFSGRGGAFPSPEEALAYPYTDDERARIRAIEARGIVGTADQCKRKLESLAADYGADELIVLTITYDFSARLKSYELLASAFGLSR